MNVDLRAQNCCAGFCTRFRPMLLTLQMFLQLASVAAPSVAPETLAAFAQHESGLNSTALHDNTTGLTLKPATAEEAVALASSLLMQGHSLDLGIMQVNSANMQRAGLTVAGAFDPAQSIRAGAQILAAAYQQCRRGGPVEEQAALRCAASVYNTGDARERHQQRLSGEGVARRRAAGARDPRRRHGARHARARRCRYADPASASADRA